MASTSSFSLSSFTVPKTKSLSHTVQSLSSSSLRSAAPAASFSVSVVLSSAKRFDALSSRFESAGNFEMVELGRSGFHGPAFNLTKRGDSFLKIQATATLETPETEVKKRKIKTPPVDPAFNGRIDLSQVLRSPLLTEAAIKELSNNNTLVFVVDVKANKKMIRAALKSLLDVDAKRVNTSIRPDGTKKAFIQLAPEYNASDVAKRIGIFSG